MSSTPIPDRSVQFGDYNTTTDFGLIFHSVTVGSPEPDTHLVDVPYRDGSIDLTEFFGPVRYKDRSLSFKFLVPYAEDHMLIYTSVLGAIHGKRMKIIISKDQDWYYYGRVKVGQLSVDGNFWAFPVDATVYPYKFTNGEAFQDQFTISNSSIRKVYTFSGTRAIPIITFNPDISDFVNLLTLPYADDTSVQEIYDENIAPIIGGLDSFAPNSDGSFTAQGTMEAGGYAAFWLTCNTNDLPQFGSYGYYLPKGDYKIFGASDDKIYLNLHFLDRVSDMTPLTSNSLFDPGYPIERSIGVAGTEFSLSEARTCVAKIEINGTTDDYTVDETFWPMIVSKEKIFENNLIFDTSGGSQVVPDTDTWYFCQSYTYDSSISRPSSSGSTVVEVSTTSQHIEKNGLDIFIDTDKSITLNGIAKSDFELILQNSYQFQFDHVYILGVYAFNNEDGLMDVQLKTYNYSSSSATTPSSTVAEEEGITNGILIAPTQSTHTQIAPRKRISAKIFANPTWGWYDNVKIYPFLIEYEKPLDPSDDNYSSDSYFPSTAKLKYASNTSDEYIDIPIGTAYKDELHPFKNGENVVFFKASGSGEVTVEYVGEAL